MLLNLSNHPSHHWTPAQRQAAEADYGSITDLPFPQVPPEASTDQVRQLIEKYEAQIRRLKPAAVHLMGEMTFTFGLVQRLQGIGIPCIASTTERIVDEDGQRRFAFKQFRAYP